MALDTSVMSLRSKAAQEFAHTKLCVFSVQMTDFHVLWREEHILSPRNNFSIGKGFS